MNEKGEVVSNTREIAVNNLYQLTFHPSAFLLLVSYRHSFKYIFWLIIVVDGRSTTSAHGSSSTSLQLSHLMSFTHSQTWWWASSEKNCFDYLIIWLLLFWRFQPLWMFVIHAVGNLFLRPFVKLVHNVNVCQKDLLPPFLLPGWHSLRFFSFFHFLGNFLKCVY